MMLPCAARVVTGRQSARSLLRSHCNLRRTAARRTFCAPAARSARQDGGRRLGLGVAVGAAFAARTELALGGGGVAKAEASVKSQLEAVAARLAAIEESLAPGGDDEGTETVVNWSATHTVETKKLHQPETLAELEALVACAHADGRKLRVLGSAISPNGIGFSSGEMVTLSLYDRVLSVDTDLQQVTVEAGARVQQVVEALREHQLTLQNYASIAEQQIGGFISVGAHGTGAQLPTVDDTVVRMKLITPSRGTIEVSATQEPELFHLAKVGLGALGVVVEVTLQCVQAHELLEHTFVRDHAWVKAHHKQTLQENQHVRYMWVPYTDSVIVVTNNPITEGGAMPVLEATYTNEERLAHFRALFSEVFPDIPKTELEMFSFADFRDKLISHAPLDKPHIVKVNIAEAEFWKRSEGYARGPSDTKLQFECGGQQWVSEVGFPCGSFDEPSGADLEYMERTLALIEREDIAAPSPIEVRLPPSAGCRCRSAVVLSRLRCGRLVFSFAHELEWWVAKLRHPA